jgi:gliding motility-associated-like protein
MKRIFYLFFTILSVTTIYSQDVLVVFGSDSGSDLQRATNLATRLRDLSVFNSVTGIHLNSTTQSQVTLSYLNQFDAVMIATNGGYSTSWGFDARLRDYVNGGGGVAVMMFANASIPLGNNWPFKVLNPANQSNGTTQIGQVQLPNHPSLRFPYVIDTTTWNIGNTFSSTATTLANGAYSIFKFSDDRPGLQALENVGTSGYGRVIDLAIWPDYASNYYNIADKLVANVLTWLMGAIQVAQSGDCITSNQSTFTFIDNNSTNPVVSYSWNFGDNTTSTQSTPSKIYSTAGNFTVTVTVTRQNNDQQTFGTNVTIYDLPSAANAGNDITLNAGLTSASLTPTNPTTGRGTWTRVSGPNTPTLSQTGNVANLSGLVDGNYVFRWTVSSGTCTPSVDDVIVSIGNVATIPSAPTNLTATAENGQAQISFTAGADGGAVITNYEYSINNGINWVALNPVDTTSPITIPGLTNGTQYSIQIRAVNSVGAGAASNSMSVTPVVNLASLGGITIVNTTGAAENSGWSYSNGMIVPTSSTAVAINASDVIAKLALGNLIIGASSIDINETVNYATNANGITFKTTGNIVLAPSKSVITNGGHVVLWSNADGEATNGGIFLKEGSSIVTAGGHVWLGGGNTATTWNGLTVGNGYAVSGRSVSDMRIDMWKPAIGFDQVTLSSVGGNIYIAGQRNENSIEGAGFINYSGIGTLIDAGSGTIVLKGNNTGTGAGLGVMTGLHPGSYSGRFVVKSSNATAVNAISIEGSTTVTTQPAVLIENHTRLISSATSNGGAISITGVSTNNALSIGTVWGPGTLDVLSASGNINVNLGNNPLSIYGADSFFRLGSIQSDVDVPSSSANVVVTSNNVSWAGSVPIRTSGTLTVTPTTANSFASAFNTTALNYTGISGLTIGNTSNTSSITIGSTTAVAGPVTVYGGNIAINAALTATNNTINLNASGTVTQTAAVTASNLSLNGLGNFTLNNISNNITTLAGGNSTTKLGSVSFTDASGGLTIGTVGANSGLTASGTILVETLADNLTISNNITTDNTTANAITINAGKSAAIGTVTGGNIVLSGSPTITTGTGGIAKLFSGAASTALTAFVGGLANTRNAVDETITTFSPALTSGLYALYRAFNPVAPTDISLSSASINENNAVNAVVGTLTTTDADSGDTHTYTLVSGSGDTDNTSFTISGNQLRTSVAFDFETKSSYRVRIKTTDAAGLSFEKSFTILIYNVDETPVLSSPQSSIEAVVGLPITPFVITNATSGTTTYAISPALPVGMLFNTTTGSITGTPTVGKATTTYTITATTTDGSASLTFTLFVDQDTDGDGILDSTDTDDDGDTILDINDAFPLDKNEWKDTDGDGIGDNADTDDDNDGILDVCDVDVNGDGIPDNGVDMDGDGIIDSCDTDRDGDGVNNTSDNCPDLPNTDQADRDRDGKGDVCDTTELNVSEGLTPNGDGINDTWVVYNLENHPGSIVRVFNANGKEVFYSNNYQNDWSGNYQGSSEMLPVGSYLYQIDLGGNGSIDVQGWLYITK